MSTRTGVDVLVVGRALPGPTRGELTSLIMGQVFDLATSRDALLHLRAPRGIGGGRPRIILLDPVNDEGGAFLRTLRADEELRRIPTVLFVDPESSDDVLDGYRDGANAVVPRPRDVQAYHHAIRNLARFWLMAAMLPS